MDETSCQKLSIGNERMSSKVDDWGAEEFMLR